MSDRSDVLIVGGGVIGLAVAYELLVRGRSVRVLDRGRVGRAATWASAGMLAPISEADRAEPTLVPLALDSLDRFPGFIARVEEQAGASCGLQTGGLLHVAVDRDDEGDLCQLEETLRRLDLPTRRLDHSEVLEREPHVTGRVLGGLLVERDHQVDPRLMVAALATAVRRLGGDVLEGHAVDELLVEAGRVTGARGSAAGEAFRYHGQDLLLAAGAWTSEGLCSSATALGVRPVKGQLLRLRGERIVRSLVWTPKVYIVPRAAGEMIVGGTVEEMGFDTTPTAGAVWDLMREAWRAVPGLYDLEFLGVDVGLRPAVADNNPVIDRGEPDGLWLATGHYRQGILLAPATAHYLAEWMTTGREPPEVSAFGADRLRPTHATVGREGA